MKTKILSVDDSATMRRVVGRTVAVLGFDLLEAGNGEEAIALIKANPDEVALVILDVNMPVLDGEETLHLMKADPELSSIPVMMLTTESERSRVLGFIQSGATNYLMKPFSQDDLAAKITACLGLGF